MLSHDLCGNVPPNFKNTLQIQFLAAAPQIGGGGDFAFSLEEEGGLNWNGIPLVTREANYCYNYRGKLITKIKGKELIIVKAQIYPPHDPLFYIIHTHPPKFYIL